MAKGVATVVSSKGKKNEEKKKQLEKLTVFVSEAHCAAEYSPKGNIFPKDD